jgi:hypothetical protein
MRPRRLAQRERVAGGRLASALAPRRPILRHAKRGARSSVSHVMKRRTRFGTFRA